MSGEPRNSYLAKICAAMSANDPQSAIERVLQRHRSDGDTLREVAAQYGVDRIVEEPLPFDGGIFRVSRDRNVIKLNSDASPFRKRFTLAHEIGHLVVASVASSSGTPKCRKSKNLERACDMIAAELLMPASKVREVVGELKSSSPRNLKILADRFGVSLQAAAVRVHNDLLLWKRHIGMWKWESALCEIWFVGRRPWDTRSPGFYAFESARRSYQTVRCMDVTRRGESVEPVSLELLNIGADRILGLVGAVS
jgi:Zn-dependent peptidase ImmA (M78 family)